MCGRFTLTASDEEVASAFGAAVVGLKPDRRRGLALLRWGLVPNRSESAKPKVQPINARAESVAWKFGGLLRGRRCLIPADGFYEWRTNAGRKTPYRFTLATGRPFAFAGLWDVWQGGRSKLVTCCLITTAANDLVRPFHGRMPVILPPDAHATWLDPDTSEREATALLRPYPAELMAVAEAGAAVNSPKNDGPECLAPAA